MTASVPRTRRHSSPGWTIPGTTTCPSRSGPSSPGRAMRVSAGSCCCISNTGRYWLTRRPSRPRLVGESAASCPTTAPGRSAIRQPHRRFRVSTLLDHYQVRAGVAVNASRPRAIPVSSSSSRSAIRVYRARPFGQSHDRLQDGEAERKGRDRRSAGGDQEAAGVRPKGWLGQDYGERQRTPKLLADTGLDYVLDWPNDDQPSR